MERLRPGDPESIGPYTLIARLGAGGMGTVFLGTKGLARVAIKVVRNSYLDDPSLRTRFDREIQTLRRLDSPHIAAFVDSGSDDDIAWHASEFINGSTLKEQVELEGPLDEQAWWVLADQLRQALESIHTVGVVHRDIKPSNIVMSESGIKLIDFGIATDLEATSLTVTGSVAGSPAWLSPEHLDGSEITAASDLFSAGSVLVYAATGQSPWGNEKTLTMPTVYQRILNGSPSFDGLSPRQIQVVTGLLQDSPASRVFAFASPGTTTPDTVADPRDTSTPTAVVTSTSNRRVRRPVGVVLGVVFLVIATVSGLWFASQTDAFVWDADESTLGDDGLGVDGVGNLVAGRYDFNGISVTVGARNSEDQLILGAMLALLLDSAGARVNALPSAPSAEVRGWLESGAIDLYAEYDGIGADRVGLGDTAEATVDGVDLADLSRLDQDQNGIAWVGESTVVNDAGDTLRVSMTDELLGSNPQDFRDLVSELFGQLTVDQLQDLAASTDSGDHWKAAERYLQGQGLIRQAMSIPTMGQLGYSGDLQTGDCYDAIPDVPFGEPDIYFVDCDKLHTFEMFDRVTLPDTAYPGDDAVIEDSTALCEAAFDDFMGIDYLSSTFYVWSLWPNEQLWNEGDRDAFCVVYEPDTYQVGSVAGLQR